MFICSNTWQSASWFPNVQLLPACFASANRQVGKQIRTNMPLKTSPVPQNHWLPDCMLKKRCESSSGSIWYYLTSVWIDLKKKTSNCFISNYPKAYSVLYNYMILIWYVYICNKTHLTSVVWKKPASQTALQVTVFPVAPGDLPTLDASPPKFSWLWAVVSWQIKGSWTSPIALLQKTYELYFQNWVMFFLGGLVTMLRHKHVLYVQMWCWWYIVILKWCIFWWYLWYCDTTRYYWLCSKPFFLASFQERVKEHLKCLCLSHI